METEGGSIYIITNPNLPNWVKIGISKNLNKRLTSYQTGDPHRSYIIEYSFFHTKYKEAEKKIKESVNNTYPKGIGVSATRKNMKIKRHKRFNDSLPYTYYIKRKLDGLQYHGVRFQNIKCNKSPLEDFGTYYFTSGKFKKEFKLFPFNFEWKIKWTFDCPNDALLYETKINKKLYKRKKWINSYGKYFPVKQCNIGREKTLLLKYGVTHNSKIPSVVEKRKQSFLKKYGVDNPTKSKEILEKIKKTNLKKFGVEWTGQCDIVKEKMKSTFLKKYGVDNPRKTEFVKNKIEKTNLKKYGVKYHFQLKTVIDKIHEKRKKMYIKLAKMSDIEFNNYLLKLSPLLCIQNQKKTQRQKGMKILQNKIIT